MGYGFSMAGSKPLAGGLHSFIVVEFTGFSKASRRRYGHISRRCTGRRLTPIARGLTKARLAFRKKSLLWNRQRVLHLCNRRRKMES